MIKKTIVTLVLLIGTISMLFAHTPFKKSQINLNGLYIAKTGEIDIPNNKMDIYTYLRFYDDGSVYTQSVTSYNPEKVATWFGENGKFERKGTYQVNHNELNFSVNNDESTDKKLEGAMSNVYKGIIKDANTLLLDMKHSDGSMKKNLIFEFYALD